MVKNLDLLDADELINNLYSKFKNDEEILNKAYLYASEGHLNQKIHLNYKIQELLPNPKYNQRNLETSKELAILKTLVSSLLSDH